MTAGKTNERKGCDGTSLDYAEQTAMPKKKSKQSQAGKESSSSQGSLPTFLHDQQCSLAIALLDDDRDAIGSVLKESLPSSKKIGEATVQDVDVQKSVGEAFTGGRSTPVYSISATIHRSHGTFRKRHFIAKLVLMEDGEGAIFPTSKQQQLRESYAVERRFYDTICHQLRAFGLTIPKLLHSDLDGSKCWPVFCILMNDVTCDSATACFPEHPETLNMNQAKAALKWIASFHAAFWGSKKQERDSWRLWDRGGFWTKTSTYDRIGANWLQTIRYIENKEGDALTAKQSSLRTFGKRLQVAAPAIRESLTMHSNSCKYGTIIHGDYKAANLFLSANGSGEEDLGSESVAVVDFQYTGGGVGSDDVAYLLYPDARGAFSDDQILGLTEVYHTELIEQLITQGKGGPSTISLETFRTLFQLSQLDMTRHWLQKGWAASTPAEVQLMLRLDKFLSENFDGGNDSIPPDIYERRLSELPALA